LVNMKRRMQIPASSMPGIARTENDCDSGNWNGGTIGPAGIRLVQADPEGKGEGDLRQPRRFHLAAQTSGFILIPCFVVEKLKPQGDRGTHKERSEFERSPNWRQDQTTGDTPSPAYPTDGGIMEPLRRKETDVEWGPYIRVEALADDGNPTGDVWFEPKPSSSVKEVPTPIRATGARPVSFRLHYLTLALIGVILFLWTMTLLIAAK
jgi:hypothetical protein